MLYRDKIILKMRTTIKLFLPIIIALSITFTSTAQPTGSFISEEAQESCVKYGEEYGICPELLMAMIEKESSGRPDVESGGCKGLMQISDRWHKDRMERLGVTDIYSVDGNIHVGADYLAELFEKYCDVGCNNCIFAKTKTDDKRSCEKRIKEWSEQEYVEPSVDWSKVPVDTKVFVRDSDSDPWKPRYFAKIEGGKIFTWTNGATSFSRNSVCDSSWWNQGKLAEDTV
nr:MAG TPA: hypothetical protein [Bacteriophage sp.]